MAFGKTVRTKTLDLIEAVLCESTFIAPRNHSFYQFLFKLPDRTDIAECRHGPAQPIGFLWRETRGGNGKTHRLFLKQRYAAGFPQNMLKLISRPVFGRRLWNDN